MTKSEYLKSFDRSYGLDCRCCNGVNQPYMLDWALWDKLFPDCAGNETRWKFKDGEVTERKGGYFVCVGCAEEKAGRDLTLEDFIDAPINFGIMGFDCRVYVSLPNTKAA